MNNDDNIITSGNAASNNGGNLDHDLDSKYMISTDEGTTLQNFSTNTEIHPTDDIYTQTSGQVEQDSNKLTVISDHNSFHQPVTWLPAMIVNSDNHGSSFVLDPTVDSNRAAHELLSHGTFVQLPPYGSDSNKQLFGLMLGSDTVVPLDSLSIVNFPTTFNKLDQSGNLCQGETDINETMHGLVKAAVDVSNEAVQGEGYTSLATESSHNKDHLYCLYCPKVYKAINELQAHIMIDHPDQTQLSSLINDTNNIHPSLRTCPTCAGPLRQYRPYNQDFTMTGQEDEHGLQLHPTSNILLVCDACCKEFTLGMATENSTNISNLEGPKRHFCDHCDKSYKHNRDLRKHLRTHHGYDNTTQLSQHSDVYASNTHNHSSYQNATAPHSSKMVCQQCKKMFRGPFELRRHIHTVHENKRPYKCPECNKFFRDAYELKRHSASHQRLHYHSSNTANISVDHSQPIDLLHIQSASDNQTDRTAHGTLFRDVYNTGHTSSYVPPQQGSLDYYCSACEKNFRGANEFKRHHSVVHEKKYRYKCIHCGKLWRDQYDLKRHCKRSHYVDREIDRNFIRQCLLDNSTENAPTTQPPNSLSSYDMAQQMTLTFNRETAAVLFRTAEHDLHGESGQLDANFSLVDQSDFGGNQVNLTSQTDQLFQNISSIQSTSMLYPTDTSSLVENIIGSQDNDAMHEESKSAVNWSNFESDIQSEK